MAIICGTDFSTASLGALAVARALAAQRGEPEVVLVCAVDAADQPPAQQKLAAVAAAAGPGVSIRTQVVVGEAASALTKVAGREASDLIVIAASASKPLGSVAEQVVSATRVPVLVVRAPEPWLAFVQSTKPLRLMVSVDNSIPATLGIQWTHSLRARGPVDVVLGAVYYPDEAAHYYGTPAKPVVDRDPEVEALIARDLLHQFGTSDRVAAITRRGLGRIGDHLLELAAEARVDAIVIGTSQKTGLGRLGSVSTVVITEGSYSVLCVPPNAAIPTLVAPPLATALVATDLSAFGNRAVAYACSAVPQGGHVHIIHVIDRHASIDEPAIKRQLLALAPANLPRAITPHIVRGDDPAIAIAQTAARVGCDMICLASHGRSGISRAVMGSVADQVLHTTHKPVLVLRPG